MAKRTSMDVVAAKLDLIHEDLVAVKRAVEKQNGRVRKLENWRSYIMGGVCFIVLVLSWTVPTLAKVVLK